MPDQPPELPDSTRALLQAYRAERPMPHAARARVRQRLDAEPVVEVRLAASKRALWIGVAVAAAAAVVLGLAYARPNALLATEQSAEPLAPMRASDSDTSTVHPRAVPPPSRPVTRPPPARPSEIPDVPEPRPSPRAHARAKPKPRPPETAPAKPSPGARLGEEQRLIEQTWAAIRAQAYPRARGHLRAHAAEFAQGVLTPEREALLVIVDCLEHPEHATGKAKAYAKRGGTALLAKVRTLCKENRATQ